MKVLLNEPGAVVRLFYFTPAPTLQASLRELPFQPETYSSYGRTGQTRRRSVAVGDEGLVYRYKGAVRPALPWPPCLDAVRTFIRTADDQPNFCLLNRYEAGAGLGWHSDDEPDLVPGASIWSLSLGRPSNFRIRRKGSVEPILDITLSHGDLLTMEGIEFQTKFQHSVTPPRGGERINLTFRTLKG